MPKRTKGYYLDDDNIEWIAERAREDGRKDGQYLDRLLTRLREAEANAKQPITAA